MTLQKTRHFMDFNRSIQQGALQRRVHAWLDQQMGLQAHQGQVAWWNVTAQFDRALWQQQRLQIRLLYRQRAGVFGSHNLYIALPCKQLYRL